MPAKITVRMSKEIGPAECESQVTCTLEIEENSENIPDLAILQHALAACHRAVQEAAVPQP